jgi:hypothetical protein
MDAPIIERIIALTRIAASVRSAEELEMVKLHMAELEAQLRWTRSRSKTLEAYGRRS